jgi:hypothetical protein
MLCMWAVRWLQSYCVLHVFHYCAAASHTVFNNSITPVRTLDTRQQQHPYLLLLVYIHEMYS